MKRLFALLFIQFTALNLFAQANVSTEVILTDELQERNEVPFTDPVLTWDDFKGRPPRNTKWTAMTSSGIKLRYEYTRDEDRYSIKILLYPYVDQSKSWYVEAGHNNYTLAHEQLHFNITILVTKQLAEQLQAMDLSPKKFSKQINAMHDEYMERLKELQSQYDDETGHGTNMARQRIWNRKIATELRKYD